MTCYIYPFCKEHYGLGCLNITHTYWQPVGLVVKVQFHADLKCFKITAF